MRALATVMVTAGLVAAAVTAPGASAAPYTVEICTQNADGGDVVRSAAPGTTVLATVFTCGTGPGSGIRQALLPNVNGTGAISWTLAAPPGTFIARIQGRRENTQWNVLQNLVWEARSAAGLVDRFNSTTPGGPIDYAINSPIFASNLKCNTICQGGQFETATTFRDLVATMEDQVPPAGAVAPAPASPVRGIVQVPFTASDEGSGVRMAGLQVDGVEVATVEDPNGGSCVEPFRRLAPCKPRIDSSFALDTTALSEGAHQIAVRVADASGQATVSPAVTITVDNSPPPLPDPGPGPVPPISGPPTPVPPTTPGPPVQGERPPAGAAAPTLSALSISPKGLKPGKRGLLRLTGSEAGTLSVTIAPVGKGAARRKVAKPLATVTAAVAAGPASVAIRTRVKGKALRPGTYRLTATLRTADGRASAPATLRFKVLGR
jgi:hypothetical protein